MAQTFLSLPSGNPGSSVVVPVSEGIKTFYAGGNFVADEVVLEVSMDNAKFVVAGSIPSSNREPIKLSFTAPFARVRVKGLVTGSGTPSCFLAVNTISGSAAQVTFTAPASSPASGPAASLSVLPRQKTFFVVAEGNAVDCEGSFDVSMDGANFNPLFRISGQLFRNGDTVVVDGFYFSGRVNLIRGSGTGLTVQGAADPTCC